MYHLTPPARGGFAVRFLTLLPCLSPCPAPCDADSSFRTWGCRRGVQERDPLSKQQVGLAAAVQSVVAGGPVTVSFFFRTLESRVTSLPTTFSSLLSQEESEARAALSAMRRARTGRYFVIMVHKNLVIRLSRYGVMWQTRPAEQRDKISLS